MSDDLFNQHGRLISQRWPPSGPACWHRTWKACRELTEGLGSTLSLHGIQLTSRHDRVKEAELQAASLPEQPVLHLYGTGLGDLPRALWAQQPQAAGSEDHEWRPVCPGAAAAGPAGLAD